MKTLDLDVVEISAIMMIVIIVGINAWAFIASTGG